MKKIIYFVFGSMLFLFTVLAAGCGSESQTALEWQNVNIPSSIKYDYSTEDLSANRIRFDVIVTNKVDGSQMEAIAKHILYEYVKEHKDLYGAYVQFSDLNNQYVGIPFTLSKYEYGPNGSASYSEDKVDDKKVLKVVVDRGNKDWSKKPTPFEYVVYKDYMQYLHAHGESEDSEAAFVNSVGGTLDNQKITAKQVQEIYDKVNAWIMQ